MVRTLSTAEDRREVVLEAAVGVFAARGFSGTPTTEVAKAAGISHAYLFRLFPTKSDLAIAVTQRCHERIIAAFREAAARARADGDDVMHAMGEAYSALVADQEVLQLQLHAHAAAIGDPALRDASRAGFGRIVDVVAEESGAEPEAVGSFIACGMLINTLSALGATENDPWLAPMVAYLAAEKA
ncbi:MAG: TetR/AcrR family transcriptional regulator [Solirubrobacteraceae bacterium]